MSSLKSNREFLLGNEAIGRALVEAGCHFVTSYPGTPSSEILPAVLRFQREEHLNIYVHWAVNEKIAFDEALAASYCGKRSAVIMKQVGLNVAADSLMSAAYTGVKGGFLLICADDPGPHSSQTEQDSRLFALFAKIPIFDPCDPLEAMKMVSLAFEISEKYEIPTMLRPSLRVCHARMAVPLLPITSLPRTAQFIKEPSRWAATPVHRYRLHIVLNDKLTQIRQNFEKSSAVNYSLPTQNSDFGVIACGVSFAVIQDIAKELGVSFDILKIGTPHPMPRQLVDEFLHSHRRVLLLEDPDTVIELQIDNRQNVMGRLSGHVPAAGELTPDVVYRILSELGTDGTKAPEIPREEKLAEWKKGLDDLIDDLKLPVRRPTLCPGCGHRASFFAIRKALPKAIFTSDIGCYTLGLNLQAVDTVLDMGAGLTIATGLYHAYKQDGNFPPIVATMGDSTFFHSGISALVDAIYSSAKYIFVLLDNRITAMTGMQPTPETGILADGSQGNRIDIVELIKACGIKFIEIIDPYHVEDMVKLIQKAHEYTMREDGGIAVVVAQHPCIMAYPQVTSEVCGEVTVGEECDGCRLCQIRFECPAMLYQQDTKTVTIDRRVCIDCGVCVAVCPRKAISKTKE